MRFIENASKDKLRGGFYTPEKIADFMLRWAVNGNKDYDILEPSCGDGAFLSAIKRDKFDYKTITAIEYDKIEHKKASELNLKKCNVIHSDFFNYCNNSKDKFNMVVGNPPYIRYQYFKKEQREEAEKIFERAGLKYSKLTNAWVSFVVGSSLMLKEEGKIAFVLPAEILQVTYAQQLREFLKKTFNKISIVSFQELVFPNIQQEVVLLLCQKKGSEKNLIEHIEVKNAKSLDSLDVNKLKAPKKKLEDSNKWTFYFLTQKEINFLKKMKEKVSSLKSFSKVEVGITTGANHFFTVNEDDVDNHNLKDYAKPLVGRSVQVSGCNFDKSDWVKNRKANAKAFFIEFPRLSEMRKNIKAIKYIKSGEEIGYNKWYKCGIRDEWQIVPSIKISDALFVRRINKYPKFVLNSVKALTTDTMHRVSINKGVDKKALISSFYNSLSLAFSELSGRSHGGGVLELMPKETEEILIPYFKENSDLFDEIDSMLKNNTEIDKILGYTDKIILEKRLGLSKEEIKIINSIWKKLQQRRLKRKSS